MTSGLHRQLVEDMVRQNWSPPRIEAIHIFMVESDYHPRFLHHDGQSLVVGSASNPTREKMALSRDLGDTASWRTWEALPPGTLVEAWTDGSGVASDASIGCAAVLRAPGVHLELQHSCGPGTNNIGELTGIWLALANCPRPDLQLVIRSDSEYSIGSLTKNWRAKANQDLIARIKSYLVLRPARFEHVRGHAGDRWNELADQLAGRARRKT